MFSATGFSGVSDPEDIDDVDDGDNRDAFVVSPRGSKLEDEDADEAIGRGMPTFGLIELLLLLTRLRW